MVESVRTYCAAGGLSVGGVGLNFYLSPPLEGRNRHVVSKLAVFLVYT